MRRFLTNMPGARFLSALAVVAALALPLSGCEREVAEVKTPQGEVEVNKKLDGTTEIEIDKKGPGGEVEIEKKPGEAPKVDD